MRWSKKQKRMKFSFLIAHIKRMIHECSSNGFYIKNPIGEKFSEERTDIDATIMADLSTKLTITKVLKPIVYKKEGDVNIIVQKGVVIVA